eukprot:m.32194 g.32194  ORF g.32194 m.32194 type:complete len:191 (+) comp8382_c0_seq3:146-718(+)
MLLLLLTAQLAFTMNISGEISRQRRGIHENMSNGCFDGNIRVRVKDGLENFKSEVSASLLCWFIKGSKDIQIIDELEDQIKLDKDTVIPLVLKETLYAGHPLNFTDMVFLGDYRDGLKNEEYAKELDLLIILNKNHTDSSVLMSIAIICFLFSIVLYLCVHRYLFRKRLLTLQTKSPPRRRSLWNVMVMA